MRVERELEIGKWLKTAETELEIKPNQYFALVKLLEDFHNEQLRLYGVSKSFTAEDVVNELEDSDNLDDAIQYFKEQIHKLQISGSGSLPKQKRVMFKFDDDEPMHLNSIFEGGEFIIKLKEGKIKFEKDGKSFELYVE